MTLDERSASLLPGDCLVQHLPEIQLDDASRLALCQGRSFTGVFPVIGLARVYDGGRRFLGLAEVHADGTVSPRRLINTSS